MCLIFANARLRGESFGARAFAIAGRDASETAEAPVPGRRRVDVVPGLAAEAPVAGRDAMMGSLLCPYCGGWMAAPPSSSCDAAMGHWCGAGATGDGFAAGAAALSLPYLPLSNFGFCGFIIGLRLPRAVEGMEGWSSSSCDAWRRSISRRCLLTCPNAKAKHSPPHKEQRSTAYVRVR